MFGLVISPACNSSLYLPRQCASMFRAVFAIPNVSLNVLSASHDSDAASEPLAFRMVCKERSKEHLTFALSGQPQRFQARGRRTMNGALAARRSEVCHRPLERVVRRPTNTCHLF